MSGRLGVRGALGGLDGRWALGLGRALGGLGVGHVWLISLCVLVCCGLLYGAIHGQIYDLLCGWGWCGPSWEAIGLAATVVLCRIDLLSATCSTGAYTHAHGSDTLSCLVLDSCLGLHAST